jgi:hypothetical protein
MEDGKEKKRALSIGDFEKEEMHLFRTHILRRPFQ